MRLYQNLLVVLHIRSFHQAIRMKIWMEFAVIIHKTQNNERVLKEYIFLFWVGIFSSTPRMWALYT